jgi:hypothetical protein
MKYLLKIQELFFSYFIIYLFKLKSTLFFMSLIDFYKIYILKLILHLVNSIIIYFPSREIEVSLGHKKVLLISIGLAKILKSFVDK